MWQNWEFTVLWDATPWDRLSRCELHGIACLQILRLWKLMVSSVPGVKLAWLVSCLPNPESLRGLNKKCRQPSPLVVAWTFDIQCGASHLSSCSCRSLGGMPFATISQCNISSIDEGMFYTQVSAGLHHILLLRSDGHVVCSGSNADGQCDIPPLRDGISYTQVSAGRCHTVLLHSDSPAVACGCNIDGPGDASPLAEGMSYTQVSAGQGFHN